ncbi:MAG TPA: hypothetical protein VEI03_12715 [Stellaceae bacterium]|nr:hypothetical protein [Stellaceae bacterium]
MEPSQEKLVRQYVDRIRRRMAEAGGQKAPPAGRGAASKDDQRNPGVAANCGACDMDPK